MRTRPDFLSARRKCHGFAESYVIMWSPFVSVVRSNTEFSFDLHMALQTAWMVTSVPHRGLSESSFCRSQLRSSTCSVVVNTDLAVGHFRQILLAFFSKLHCYFSDFLDHSNCHDSAIECQVRIFFPFQFSPFGQFHAMRKWGVHRNCVSWSRNEVDKHYASPMQHLLGLLCASYKSASAASILFEENWRKTNGAQKKTKTKPNFCSAHKVENGSQLILSGLVTEKRNRCCSVLKFEEKSTGDECLFEHQSVTPCWRNETLIVPLAVDKATLKFYWIQNDASKHNLKSTWPWFPTG